MFQRLTVHLKHPFCACEPRNLEWRAHQIGIHIRCKICNAELEIPFAAVTLLHIQFDAQYPRGGLKKSVETDSELTEDDKKFLRDVNIKPD